MVTDLFAIGCFSLYIMTQKSIIQDIGPVPQLRFCCKVSVYINSVSHSLPKFGVVKIQGTLESLNVKLFKNSFCDKIVFVL